MKNCNNCIHIVVCDKQKEGNHNISKAVCKHFKDKTLFGERRQGHWIYKNVCGPHTGKWHCSECDRIPKSLCTEDFCPNCGAEMNFLGKEA